MKRKNIMHYESTQRTQPRWFYKFLSGIIAAWLLSIITIASLLGPAIASACETVSAKIDNVGLWAYLDNINPLTQGIIAMIGFTTVGIWLLSRDK